MASWSPDEIRQNASTWSLEGDAKLLQLMKDIAKNLETRCTSTTTNINNMLLDLEDCNIALGNTANQFNALQHAQFVENRVYDNDDDVVVNTSAEIDTENKLANEKEISPNDAIKLSIENSIKFMNNFYEKVPLKLDDSDDDDDDDEVLNDNNGNELENKNFVYRLKNPYQNRPMPLLIGTQEWKEKWHVGLVDSDVESEPDDKEQYSESSGDNISLTPSNDQTISGSEGDSIWGLRQPITDIKPNVFHPSSDDEDVDDNNNDDNDVSSNASSRKNYQTPVTQQKRVQVLPVLNNALKSAPVSTNIFSDEPPEDNYPVSAVKNVIKKPQKKHGLFDSDSDSDPDNNQLNDDRLDFQPNNNRKKSNEFFSAKQQNSTVERKTVNLFDDEPPETEFLPQKPAGDVIKKPLATSGKKIINLFDELDDDFDDLLPKQKAEDVATNKPIMKSFLDNDDEDDVNGNFIGSTTKRSEVKKSIFDDEDLLPVATSANPASIVNNNEEDDEDDFLFSSSKNKKVTEQHTIKKLKNLFDDQDGEENEAEDDFDKIFKPDKKLPISIVKQINVSEKKEKIVSRVVNKEPMKVPSLFDDFGDDDDDDIFGNKTKVKPVKESAKVIEKQTKPVEASKSVQDDDSDDIFISKETTKKQEKLIEAKDIIIPDTKSKTASTTKVFSSDGEDSDDIFASARKFVSKKITTNHPDEKLVKTEEKILPPSINNRAEIVKPPKIDVASVLLEDDDDFDDIFKKVDPATIKSKTADKISLKKEPEVLKPPINKFISFLDEPPSDNDADDTADDLFNKPKIIPDVKVAPNLTEKVVPIEENIFKEVEEAEDTNLFDNSNEKSSLIFNIDFDEPPEDDFDDLFTKKDAAVTVTTKSNLSSLFSNEQPPPFDDDEDAADDDENNYPDDDDNDKSINVNKNDFLNKMQTIFIDNEPPPDPEFDSQFITSLINNEKISSALKVASRKSSLFNEADNVGAGPSGATKTNRNIYYDDFADTFIPSAGLSMFSDEPPSLTEVEPPVDAKIKGSDEADNLKINNNFKEKLNLFNQQPSDVPVTVATTSPIIEDINNTKKRSVADLIQEATTKTSDPTALDNENLPQKRLAKKLNKNNLNINVAALLPGAKIPTLKIPNNKKNIPDVSPTENDGDNDVFLNSSQKYTGNDENNESGKLSHLNKNRIKIQVKRRPSTRRGREENYRKSLLSVGNDLNENSNDDDVAGVPEIPVVVAVTAPKLKVPEIVPKENELCIKDEKILALFAEEENKKVNEQKKMDLAQQKLRDEAAAKIASNEKSKMSIINQLASKEIKKPEKKSEKLKKASLFDSSNDEDDDLFSKKGNKKIATENEVSVNSKSVVVGKTKQTTLFDDDDDDDDDSLFGSKNTKKKIKNPTDNVVTTVKAKTSSLGETKKKTSLFGESDDDDNFDDIFTPKTGKTQSVQSTSKPQNISSTHKKDKKSLLKTKSTSSTNDDPLADLLNG